MLLSDWYLNWKEKRIKAAAEKARDEGYEKGYAAGKKVAKSGKDAGSVKRGGKVK